MLQPFPRFCYTFHVCPACYTALVQAHIATMKIHHPLEVMVSWHTLWNSQPQSAQDLLHSNNMYVGR